MKSMAMEDEDQPVVHEGSVMSHADFTGTGTALRYECKDCDFTTGSLRSAAKHEQESGHATDVAADED